MTSWEKLHRSDILLRALWTKKALKKVKEVIARLWEAQGRGGESGRSPHPPAQAD